MPVLQSRKPISLLGKRNGSHRLPDYPADHKVGMKVPVGGSDCAKCEYVDGQNCTNRTFVKWNGSTVIPEPTNQYCCDFFEVK